MNKHVVFIALLLFGFLLSGCSAWKEDFEQKPVRGYPKASIHEISTMVNRCEIKEDDAGSVTTIGLNSDNAGSTATGGTATSFYDGEISRGYEKVQRIYVASYEDENKILHEAHNLYVVVKSAEWTFHRTVFNGTGVEQ